jgi:DNA-binding response OmpR family regulator
LIIDDDDAVRGAFQLALRDGDYELMTADNGKTGAQLALANKVDLVYLDLNMPGIDGIETLRRIRAAKPALRVYMVTAFQRDFFEKLVDARAEGLMFELLRKPLDRYQIIEVTAAILG